MLRLQLLQGNMFGWLTSNERLSPSALGLVLTALILVLNGSGHAANVPDSPSDNNSVSHKEENDRTEELFLQHFISRSLKPEIKSPKEERGNLQLSRGADVSTPAKSLSLPALKSQPSTVTTAAVKMILSLGGILLVLVAIAYFIRRSNLVSGGSGKAGAILRVTARAPITAKSMVAVVEVSGKSILLGVTGTSLTMLAEIPMHDKDTLHGKDTLEEVDKSSGTFEASLEQYAKKAGLPKESEVNFLTVQEAIQKKVSNLKRL
jgi:flagellar biogenesis protein FliO